MAGGGAAHAPRARALTESQQAWAHLPRVSSGSVAAATLSAESLRSRAAVESRRKEAQGAGEARSWTFSLPHLRDPHALRRGNDRHAATVGRGSRELRVFRVRGRGRGRSRRRQSRAGKARYPALSAPTPLSQLDGNGSCWREHSCEKVAFEGSAGSKLEPTLPLWWREGSGPGSESLAARSRAWELNDPVCKAHLGDRKQPLPRHQFHTTSRYTSQNLRLGRSGLPEAKRVHFIISPRFLVLERDH
nr:uncharacterized protein LOC129010776 [Pongo pygmaeus]